MFHYWQKTICAEQWGMRLLSTECTQCSYPYSYLLTRVARGQFTTPYGIGIADFVLVAQERCRRNLQALLEEGEEAVPCPKCHWVKDGLVKQYLAEHHRWQEMVTFLLGGLGIAGSLAAGWCILDGSLEDPVLGFLGLIAGLFLTLVLGAVWLAHRQWRTRVIEANQNAATPLWLPPGTPNAIMRSAEGDLWKQVLPPETVTEHQGEWTDFRVGLDDFPQQCCGCLSTTADGTARKMQFGQLFQIEAPYCASCERKDAYRHLLVSLTAIGFCLIPGGAFLLYLRLPPTQTLLAGLAGIVAGILLLAVVSSLMLAPVKMQVVDFHRGVARVRFRNPVTKHAYRQHRENEARHPIDSARMEVLVQMALSSVK